jgi:putative ubiquitin-RnfH superfamily antitoxin RatB of RatAB toxin-antitoxin module
MAAEGATIRVSVVYAQPERAWVVDLELPAGATASEAMTRSGVAAQVPGLDVERIAFAIYGKAIEPGTLLRDGDRLELLRPLVADPKQARRRRAHKRS